MFRSARSGWAIAVGSRLQAGPGKLASGVNALPARISVSTRLWGGADTVDETPILASTSQALPHREVGNELVAHERALDAESRKTTAASGCF